MPKTHLASFSCDVTPPLGHPLCGGWITEVQGVDDPLRCLGIVLFGPEKPLVLASVDWCGLRNEAHRIWQSALAKAAHTTPDRVALHCVHPHNAPFADVEAEKLIRAVKGPTSLDLDFFQSCVKKSAEALGKSLLNTKEITHTGYGTATVAQVASNRRVLGPDGKVKFTRTSATKIAAAREAPEGVIDSSLRTLSFWTGDQAVAALHFYATHPMSYYGDGRVSADFCGLARQKRKLDDPSIHQVYFTGCAGNITAGKYNDGSPDNRAILRDRIYKGISDAWKQTTRQPLTQWQWQTEPITFRPRPEPEFGEAASKAVLEDTKQTKAKRNNAAFQLAWLKRIATPIELGCLTLGDQSIALFLPGEPFVEYQLLATKLAKTKPICVAGYGDGGPGYIPLEKSFAEGGYEPTVALAQPDTEHTMTKAVSKLLKGTE